MNSAMNIGQIRLDFPILHTKVDGWPLIYLDNAASSQMPQAVIDTIVYYQTQMHANVHRGIHYLSELATAEYETARVKVQKFINAAAACEIIFTAGCTDSINLVMQSYGRSFIHPGDEIILSLMEHHSNLVPWQMLAEERGAVLKVIPVNAAGELDLIEYKALLSERTKLVAISHVSNVLGTINPLAEIIALAHSQQIPVVVDGAQAVPHLTVDVQQLDCDFYAFSGHKLYGPTGVGVLYAKAAWLEKMPPYRGGGGMILAVTFGKTIYNEIPYKFEAGTPPIMPACALGAALDYIQGIGLSQIGLHEQELLKYATERLQELPGLTIIGTAAAKVGVVSFSLDEIHPHDIATILNAGGIAIRSGHHCAQPLMQHLGVAATARASFGMYNTLAEIDQLVFGLQNVQRMFR